MKNLRSLHDILDRHLIGMILSMKRKKSFRFLMDGARAATHKKCVFRLVPGKKPGLFLIFMVNGLFIFVHKTK